MKNQLACRRVLALQFTMLIMALFDPDRALGVTTVFFDATQTTNLVASGTTSDTISSEGYLFTFTRDKLFTGGVGLTNPIGRYIRVPWPEGLEAQAVTAGPVPSGARIDIKRVDGELFAIETFTAQLLANTSGAGGALEVMPVLPNGEDGFLDPLACPMSGTAGQSFNYVTPQLTGFAAYKLTLYVDYALMSLTVVDASLPPPVLEITPAGGVAIQISWPASATGFTLESALSLPSNLWTAVTNDVAVNGDLFTVQLDAGGSERFFRLRK